MSSFHLLFTIGQLGGGLRRLEFKEGETDLNRFGTQGFDPFRPLPGLSPIRFP